MTKINESLDSTKEPSFWALFKVRDFRLLWGAGFLSSIGDQFDLIAFPWLVLLITGDPLAVGMIIAVGAIPTLFFMLIGGSLADRFSPRLIIQISNIARAVMGVALAALILTGLIQLWLLYLFALLKGIADAFYYPAQAAILPRIVSGPQLRQANAVTQTTVEMSGFIGPMLAGALIAFFSSTNDLAVISSSTTVVSNTATSNIVGVGLAFAILAVAFFVSATFIALIRLDLKGQQASEQGIGQEIEESDGSIFASITRGIRFVRADALMFTLFLLIAGIELLVQGPVGVGIPVLANTQLPEGALAVGIISSAYAIGALIGALSAGILPAPKRHLGPIFMASFGLSGLLLMPFGFLTNTWIAAGLVVVIGLMGGYTNILFTTWLQGRTPQAMMGRVMSLLMVASIGVSPISSAASGALIKLSLGWVFVGAGLLMALLCLFVGLRHEIRNMTMPIQ